MKNIKTVVAAALGLLIVGQVSAHDNYNYLHINAGGGLHTLRHNPELGSSTPGFGGTFNANYIHFFGKHSGIGTGVGLSYYQSRSKIEGMDVSAEFDTYNGQYYEYRMIYTDWKETQRALDLEIPLGYYNRFDFNDHTSFMAGIGGKFCFPFYYRYEVTDGEIETKGFYPFKNVLFENIPHHGFGFDDTKYSGSNDRKPAFAIYLDLGLNHWIKDNLAIYWGLYCNYGLTDLIKSHKQALYDKDANYAGVHNSNQVDKVRLLAVGAKIGVTIPFGKKPEPEVSDTVFVKDTVSLEDQLVLQTPDTLAADSSWIDVADMIEKLPNWDRFNYKNKPALEEATKAFAALSDSAKAEIPENLRDKLLGLNTKVAQSTIPNLESSLKIKHSYGFAFSSSDGHFTNEQLEYMHFIADCLKMNPQAKISVIGYTCNIGSENQNEVFGYDRAIHVRNYLVRYGAFEDQIEMDTRTFHNPVAPNNCEENRSKNRRTEINLIKK
ncbi:MAG: OmpA family protein [Bacteroidales bacterium]|nr:OmpA family protein [Bacteroidales bacterium]